MLKTNPKVYTERKRPSSETDQIIKGSANFFNKEEQPGKS